MCHASDLPTYNPSSTSARGPTSKSPLGASLSGPARRRRTRQTDKLVEVSVSGVQVRYATFERPTKVQQEPVCTQSLALAMDFKMSQVSRRVVRMGGRGGDRGTTYINV